MNHICFVSKRYTPEIEEAFHKNLIEQGIQMVKQLRANFHKHKYNNMNIYYDPEILSTEIDELLQTLYEKATLDPYNIDYQDLLNECKNVKPTCGIM